MGPENDFVRATFFFFKRHSEVISVAAVSDVPKNQPRLRHGWKVVCMKRDSYLIEHIQDPHSDKLSCLIVLLDVHSMVVHTLAEFTSILIMMGGMFFLSSASFSGASSGRGDIW